MVLKSIGQQLIDSSIRLRRTDFRPNPNQGFDEVFLILSSLVPSDTGPVNVTDPNGDVLQIDGFDDLNVPPIDLNFPEIIFPEEVNQTRREGTTTTVEKNFSWHRTVVPGVVLSSLGNNLYSVQVSPTGSLTTKSQGQFTFNPPDTPYQKISQVRQLDSANVEVNTHVLVLSISELLVEKHTIRNNDDNGVVESWTEISVVQNENVMQAVASSGGRLAKTGSGGVPKLSGSTPGSATVTFYDFTGADMVPSTGTDGSEVVGTVYNMASEDVGANKFIQVKTIGGFSFVDVEDCATA